MKNSRIRNLVFGTVAVLALVGMLVMPKGAGAAPETSPYSLEEQDQNVPRREDAGKIHVFGATRSAKGIAIPKKWLWQARVGGYPLNLRLFAPDGEGRLFQENLTPVSAGSSDVILQMRTRTSEGGLHLQVDHKALDILERHRIRQIVVVDQEYFIQNTYDVAELQKMREYLELRDNEQLCLGSATDPISVVSENGYRRMLTQ